MGAALQATPMFLCFHVIHHGSREAHTWAPSSSKQALWHML